MRKWKDELTFKNSDKSILTDEEAYNLFSNIELIQGINSKLCEEIKKTYESWSRQEGCIGKTFIDFAHYFRLYQDYCNNTNVSQQTREKLMSSRKHKDFRKFIEKEENYEGMGLESFLITPI